LILTLSSATVALSSPVPKAPKWEHPEIDDMMPFECAVGFPSLLTPTKSHRLTPQHRSCLRRYSYVHDVESKTREQYCDKRFSEARHWFEDYIDQCWTLGCGSDPWMTQNLMNSKSECERSSIRGHQLIFVKLVTYCSKVSAADELVKMALVDGNGMPCRRNSSIISKSWTILTVFGETTSSIGCSRVINLQWLHSMSKQ
jgi:hypothetical protein